MQRKTLEKFPEGVLEHIAKTIGDYRTGSEIADLLRNAGYSELSQISGTKWRYLYDVFKQLNIKPNGQYDIAKITQFFCNPAQWIGKEDTRKLIMNTLNEGLALVNLQLNSEGQIIITQVRISHEVKESQNDNPLMQEEIRVKPVFKARGIKTEEDLCFVIMPLQPSFERIYIERIKPTVEACRFRCLKANDLFSPTSILEDIWTYICKSKVIIADVTGKNPNVFYEMGIAHTLGKPIIMVTQNSNDVPFDVAQFRYFPYSDNVNGWNVLSNNIYSALKSIIIDTKPSY